jgi:hypothetical protein
MRALFPDPTLFGTPTESLLSLLYRYWFWGWLFADASQRDLLRRAEALRFNIAQRIHLLCYIRRWTFCSVVLLVLGYVFEGGFGAAPANTCAALALVVLLVASTEWLLLTTHRAPNR